MRKRLTIIRGVIVPATWDEHGNVTAIAISARDENEYRVEMVARGGELMRLVNREVQVSGRVTEGKDRRTIAIRDYSLLGRQ